jgi:hypothetical protein
VCAESWSPDPHYGTVALIVTQELSLTSRFTIFDRSIRKLTPNHNSEKILRLLVKLVATLALLFVFFAPDRCEAAAPTITSLSPTSGPVGTLVTITGTNFGGTQGSSTIKFNGTAATPTSWSSTSITAPVPSGATSGNVIVTVAGAPSNGSNFTVAGFTATGNLNTGRGNQTATLLNNGEVLVVGGYDNSNNVLASAELYNPASGTFTATGNLNIGRVFHTAALLANGKVLIVGGQNSTGSVIASAELYDPSTGTFTLTGSLVTARQLTTATPLANGLVLVAGGSDASFNSLSSAELYNPSTGIFTATGSMSSPRSGEAILLYTGKVLVAGGFGTSGPVASADLYDPTSGTFSPTGNLNFAREDYTATALNDGKILLTGGYGTSGLLASAETYDPFAGTFTPTGTMATARDWHCATLLSNGTVLIEGGYDTNNTSEATATSELYDPVAGRFSSTGSLITARDTQTATLLNNGMVLISGGYDTSGNSLASSELYQPSSLAPQNLVSIAVSPAGPTVRVGITQPFFATGTFSDNSTELLSSSTWNSSATSIATVSNDATDSGKLFAIASGTTTVSACTGSVCGSTTVTVTLATASLGSLSPNVGSVGTTVVITGTNFGAIQGTSTVSFNGTVATVTSWSATNVSAKVPNGATTGNVIVTVGGVPSNGLTFMVTVTCGETAQSSTDSNNSDWGFGSPCVTGSDSNGYTPSSIQYWVGNPASTSFDLGIYGDSSGTPGSLLCHTGSTTLTPSAGWNNMSLSGKGCPTLNPATQYWVGYITGSNTIQQGIASGTCPGTSLHSVYTTSQQGSAVLPNPFGAATATASCYSIYLVVGNNSTAPAIASLAPSSGIVGTAVTVKGAGFGSTQGTSAVSFNGKAASVTSWSATRITATVPSGATTGNVFVTVGGAASNGLTFIVTVPAPTITGLSSTSASVSTSITVTGTNFGSSQGTSTVTFNGATAIPTSWSATSIVVPVPATATTGNVVVTVSGESSNGVNFTVVPTITSISPSSAGVGNPVTITGTGFGPTRGTATATFNGTPSAPSDWTTTSVVVPVPIGATSGNVVVTLSGATSNSVNFTVLATPVITAMSPKSGSVGTPVTITGRNFGSSQGTSTVTFSGISATPTTWSATAIVVPVPTGATTGNVVVTVSGVASNGSMFNSASRFAATGSLINARGYHTATLLNSGMVLIAGGNGGSGYLSSSELYNPGTGTFAATGNLETARFGHTATLLTSGKVLVAGGYNGSAYLSSAELYNPATGTFAPTTNLTAARWEHTATLLNNGMVLIVGGFANNTYLATAELYNPSTGTVTATGSLATARAYHTATLLNDGTVLVTGGWNGAVNGVGQPVPLASAEIYNPSAGTFRVLGNLNTARYEHTAATISSGTLSGSVFLVGGLDSFGNSLNTVETYTVGSAFFDGPLYLHNGRAGNTETPLNDGTLLVTGGCTGENCYGGYLSSAELSGLGNEDFTLLTAAMSSSRSRHTATLLNGGMVLLAGGYNGSTYLSSAELYQPASIAPVVSSLSPASGPVGTSVTITGSNFGVTQGEVTFNGTFSTPTSWSSTSIIVPVPDGATSGDVIVTVGTLTSNAVDFLVTSTSVPQITAVSPDSGLIGTSVTISGFNFGSSQGSSTVTFNGVIATPTSWSATSIVAAVPTGSSSGSIVITVGGVASNGVPFNVLSVPVPVLSNLSPKGGSTGTSVTISGSNFGSAQGTSTVTFNGTLATATSWSPASIAVPVPTGATTGPVIVTVAGLSSNGLVFAVGSGPGIQSLNPNSGSVGTSVTITGVNFGSSQGSSTVRFGALAATPTSWNSTTIVVTVPTGAVSGPVTVTVSGVVSNGVNFTVGSGPGITALSPNQGTVGTSVAISGVNFGSSQGASTVTFGGAVASPTSWSAATIVAPVPTGTTTGNVVVTVGGVPSNGALFTVDQGPLISTISPGAGPGGTVVTITGLNFGSTRGSGTVTFNGVAATPTSWSNTQIVVPVPSAATTGNVVVTTSGGFASNPVPFIVGTAPSINSLSPKSGNAGTSVTIAGTNFGSSQGSSTAMFNGVIATPTSWSATSIVAPVPTGATTGPMVVTVGGLSSNGPVFVVGSGPGITGISPSTGKVGASVTITGVNFGASQGLSTLTFNGTPATATSWTATSIVAVVPTGAKTGNVIVTVGGIASNGMAFAVLLPTPVITSLSPNSGNVGSPVTINGTNFGPTPGVVTFNGIPALTTGWSPTSIGATVPVAATTGNVVVTVNGFSSNGVLFVVGTSPSITSLNPQSGAVGTSVTITGTNFGSSQGSSIVTFNGTPSATTGWNSTTIVATVPSGATTGNVVVTVGGVASNGVLFVVGSGPGITSLSPNAGPTGTAVTITGVNFGSSQGSSTVKFNGVLATPTSWSATSIVAPVPATATTGNVVVTVGGTASNGVPFTVTPYISGISLTQGPLQMGFVITGTSFGSAPSMNCTAGQTCVALSGTPLAVIMWSAPPFPIPLPPCPTGQQCSSITVQVPSGATTGNVIITVAGQASNTITFTVNPAFCSQASCPF